MRSTSYVLEPLPQPPRVNSPSPLAALLSSSSSSNRSNSIAASSNASYVSASAISANISRRRRALALRSRLSSPDRALAAAPVVANANITTNTVRARRSSYTRRANRITARAGVAAVRLNDPGVGAREGPVAAENTHRFINSSAYARASRTTRSDASYTRISRCVSTRVRCRARSHPAARTTVAF